MYYSRCVCAIFLCLPTGVLSYVFVCTKHALNTCTIKLSTSTDPGICFLFNYIAIWKLPPAEQLWQIAFFKLLTRFCVLLHISVRAISYAFSNYATILVGCCRKRRVSRVDGEIFLKAADRPEPITLHQWTAIIYQDLRPPSEFCYFYSKKINNRQTLARFVYY